MNDTASAGPQSDPTSIFDVFRGCYGTELLVAAVAHFNVFGVLAAGPLAFEELQSRLALARRPAMVLVTALRAMRLLAVDDRGRLAPTAMAAEHLTPGGEFDVSDYLGLAASSPGVMEMVTRLRTNRPAGADGDEQGVAYIYRQGVASAMEQETLARHFTLALAGRAKNVAPVLAQNVDLSEARVLLDVGGGTGIYSVHLLQRFPQLRAIVLDRPEVLKVADEFAQAFGVASRLELAPGDMFDAAPWPEADVVLLSNILHDWDEPQCQTLVERCSSALPRGGQLLIHDVFLNDTLDGPLPIALYSAALFSLTEGRAYSAAEYEHWLTTAGLTPEGITRTLIHCGVLVASKR